MFEPTDCSKSLSGIMLVHIVILILGYIYICLHSLARTGKDFRYSHPYSSMDLIVQVERTNTDLATEKENINVETFILALTNRIIV